MTNTLFTDGTNVKKVNVFSLLVLFSLNTPDLLAVVREKSILFSWKRSHRNQK